jgi:hypothetical protein
MIGFGGRQNFSIRFLAVWCIAVLMIGPLAAERAEEPKKESAVSSSVVPAVDFSDTAAQQITFRVPAFKPKNLTLGLGIFVKSGFRSSISGCNVSPLLASLRKGTSLFLLRTLLKL